MTTKYDPDPYMVLGECLAQAIIQGVDAQDILGILLMVENEHEFKAAIDALAELKYIMDKKA